MTSGIGRREESRAKILASAGRGFRSLGFGGLGVDGLAKAAGVTSGAFYAHFKSKAEAFREAVRVGMAGLADNIAARRREGGDWLAKFIDFYTGDRLNVALAESCALQSLTSEVGRADMETRAAYEREFSRVIAELSEGDARARARSIALMALLSGGVTLGRGVADPLLREEIAASVNAAARELVGSPSPRI